VLYFIFRKQRKENCPLSEKLEVPPQKRAKFLGVGGSNLKRLLVETGVQVGGPFSVMQFFKLLFGSSVLILPYGRFSNIICGLCDYLQRISVL
jgi:hypothetical protein